MSGFAPSLNVAPIAPSTSLSTIEEKGDRRPLLSSSDDRDPVSPRDDEPEGATGSSRLHVVNVVRLATFASRLVTKTRANMPPRDPIAERQIALAKSKEKLAYFVGNSSPTILRDLAVDPRVGLSSDEAAARLAQHGRNELPKDPPTPMWRLFLEQFSDLLVMMLVSAAIASIALGDYKAAGSILVIVVGNAILGVVQESRAEAALAALESLSEPTSSVLRDGVVKEVDSAVVVPGDVLLLETGKRISADVRLIDTQGLQCGEMALTGESEPVKKDAAFVGPPPPPGASALQPAGSPAMDRSHSAPNKDPVTGVEMEVRVDPNSPPKKKKEEALTEQNMAYMGCSIVDGRGRGVVIKTGMQTKMGEIAHLLSTAQKGRSPLQIKLAQLGKMLGIGSLVVSIIVFIIGVAADRGDPSSSSPTWLQMLLVAVSLTVAAVPEGLPAAVTITLAIGMAEMVKKNALIRNLRSVETLGSATVICTDKTGTLTKGVMTAVRVWVGGAAYKLTGGGYDPTGHIIPYEEGRNPDETMLSQLSKHHAGDAYLLPLVLGAISSNAALQFIEKTNTWECTGPSSERPLAVAGRKVHHVLSAASQSNGASPRSGDIKAATAFLDSIRPGVVTGPAQTPFERLKENPFSSARKMSSVVVAAETHTIPANLRALLQPPHANTSRAPFAVVLGAPNFVLKKCSRIVLPASAGPHAGANLKPEDLAVAEMTADRANSVLKVIDAYSDQALRVLAVAYRPLEAPRDEIVGGQFNASSDAIEQDLVLAGLVASIDPERPEVAPSIQKAAGAGIRTVMITGDYVKTAKAIAENIGLLPRHAPDNKAVDCEIIRDLGNRIDALTAEGADKNKEAIKQLMDQLDTITAYADVYARAKPVDKITIVRSLQRQGNICSMTGDGVNDAPALKQANIGVAMGITGTDVAKAASDMVLTDDNFCSIVEAIEQGRTIFGNIQKFVFYLLSTNISEILTVLIPVIMALPTTLTPIQLLWMNLATDGAPAIALAMEATEPGIMRQGPRPQKEHIVDKTMRVSILLNNLLLTAVSIGTYVLGLHWNVGSWDGSHDIVKAGLMTEDQYDEAVGRARTMVLLVLSLSELGRAHAARSLRESVFTLHRSRVMNWATFISAGLTVFVAATPKVQTVFALYDLSGREWGWVVGVSAVPFTVDELIKLCLRITGYGKRPTLVDHTPLPHPHGTELTADKTALSANIV